MGFFQSSQDFLRGSLRARRAGDRGHARKHAGSAARFLHQNGGLLSKRARAKEFQKLRDHEIERIERLYGDGHDLLDSPPAQDQ